VAITTSKTFTTLVSDWAAAAQGAATALLDFTIGSILRAIAEASAGQALWLQGVCYQVLATTRLSTSQGNDVDTWLADWMDNAPGSDTPRVPGRVAAGTVTFSRATPAAQAIVPVGTQVMTTDGTRLFTVSADPLNSSYSATAGGYVVAGGVTSVDVPVAAAVSGAGGNVAAGTVTLMRAGISGIDAVTNLAQFAEGMDAETDAQAKARFPLYIASLAKATDGAIGYGISSVQAGLQYAIWQNYQHNGAYDPGYLSIIVDDGSGAPSPSLITAVALAVEQQRAAGVRFGVFPPEVLGTTISLMLTTSVGVDHNTVAAQVADTISTFVDGLGLGAALRWSKLDQIAYETSPYITNVQTLLVNGGQADVVPALYQTIKPTSVTVS
jgi:hypothetical protein